jgi:hypothetical protein
MKCWRRTQNTQRISGQGQSAAAPEPPFRDPDLYGCPGLIRQNTPVWRRPRDPKCCGRASDNAIRSLVISYKLLGTREWFVIHHTDCGMLLFTNDDMRYLLASSLKTATLDQSGWRDSG